MAKLSEKIDRYVTTDGYAYLTKRNLVAKAKSSIREAAAQTLAVMGFNVVAENGLVVKKDKSGVIVEVISKIPNAKGKGEVTLD